MEKNKVLKLFHVDLNFVSLKEDYLKKWLRKLADMGYNAILWELENKVAWETCPECVWPEAMSKETFKKLLAYSRELGLEPIPLFQTVGHGEYVLLHEKYRSFRENPERHDCYCTSKPEVRYFMKKWIDEYLELFEDIRFFHLGGDEAYEFGKCPVCKEYSDRHGKNTLYAEHIIDISRNIVKHGARPGVWGDMILNHPKEMNSIPKEFVIWDWNYWGSDTQNETVNLWGKGYVKLNEITEDNLKVFPHLKNVDGSLNAFYTSDFLKSLGYDVILCSSSRSHGDSNYCGRHNVHSQNIVGCARKTATSGLLGNCVTSWAIRLSSYETQEQWLVLAPLAMDNPLESYYQLLAEAGRYFFKTDAENFFKAIELIGSPFLFTPSLHVGIQWNHLKDSLLPPKGYIAGFIESLKEEKHPYWENRNEDLAKAGKNILEGIALLNSFITRNAERKDILYNWSIAGNFQLWQLQLGKEVLGKFEGEKPDGSQGRDILLLMKENYMTYSSLSQTPQSAKLNTALMYDALIEYMSS
ncbi:MAG: hypothetical protein A2020_11750 [Lentisphaerae bacterium GWF2_45_14]|nr:MAG: hypothetical protein A2020_11750 [Lentisphaerae bacterium GWF2_45_14]